MLWWVSVAPLGEPVVPLVNWMLMGSSNCSVSAELRERVAVARAAHAGDLVRRQSRRALSGRRSDHARSCGSRAALQRAGRGGRQFGQQRVQHLHVIAGLERGRRDDRGAADFANANSSSLRR